MKKLAVLGCGAQSQIFCLNAPKHLGNDYFVTSVCAKNHEHAVELANRVGGRAAYTVDDMLELAVLKPLKRMQKKFSKQGPI